MDQPISIDEHNITMLDFRKQGIDRLFEMGSDEKALISDRVAALVCVLEITDLKMPKDFRSSPICQNFLSAAEKDRVYLRERKAASLAALLAMSVDATLDNKSRNLSQRTLRRFSA